LDKIQGLNDKNQRYYPKDGKGNLDEWAAIIKRQEDAYKQGIQEKQLAIQH